MPANPPVRDSSNRLALLGLAVLLPWLALLQPVHQINHDVAWFYYAARGVMQGGTLYKDFIDPNAPLASMSLVPAVLLSRFMAIGPGLAVELEVLVLASVSMVLSLNILRRIGLSARALLLSLAALTAAFIFLPNAAFGQREHILAMLLTPYMLGCILACIGGRLPRVLGCAAGLAAAFAVGLKPHFVMVPAALELTVMFQAGFRAVFRAQVLALGAGLALIVAATLAFFPLYASEVVPWAVALYGGYNTPVQLFGYVMYALYVGVALWFSWGAGGTTLARAARLCIAMAAAGALSAFILQAKGSVYQILPCSFFLLLMNAGALAATGLWPGPSPADRGRWILARLLAAGFVLNIVTAPYRSVNLTQYANMEKAIAAEPGPFLILSSNVVPAFPMVLALNRVWASRMPCLIMLPGLVKAEAHGQTSPWDSVFRGWIADDLRHYRPALVLLPPNGDQSLPPDFDVLPWLLRDPAFSRIWGHYHADGVLDGFRVFRLS